MPYDFTRQWENPEETGRQRQMVKESLSTTMHCALEMRLAGGRRPFCWLNNSIPGLLARQSQKPKLFLLKLQ